MKISTFGFEISKKKENPHIAYTLSRGNTMLTITFHWPNLISLHKVKAEAALAVFLSKFQKPANPYPTNFLKLNYIRPAYQLSRSKYWISVRVPALWNAFLTDSEMEMENWPSSYRGSCSTITAKGRPFICIAFPPYDD